MTYQPLTPEQYRKARAAGFSPEQIVANEQKRKAAAGASTTPQVSAAPSIPVSPKTLSKPSDVLVGAFSGFSSIGRTIKNKTMNPVLKAVFGPNAKGAEEAKPYAPDTVAGKVGSFAGEMAPFFLAPGSQALAALSTPARVATRVGLNSAVGTAQTGSAKEGAKNALISEAILGAAGPIAQLGKGLYKTLAIPTSATEASRLQNFRATTPLPTRVGQAITGRSTAPITADETAFSKGLWGTESMIGVQAKRAQKEVWDKVVAPALKNNKTQVQLSSFFDDAEKAIVKSTPDLTRQKSLLNALGAIREDYAAKGSVNLEELQNLKASWAQWVPEKAYRGENIAPAINEVRNVLAGKARATIEASIADPAVKRAYLDYGNLLGLTKYGQRAMTGAKLKGGAGSFVSGVKDAVVTPAATSAGLLINKGAKATGKMSLPLANSITALNAKQQEGQQ